VAAVAAAWPDMWQGKMLGKDAVNLHGSSSCGRAVAVAAAVAEAVAVAAAAAAAAPTAAVTAGTPVVFPVHQVG
jgi:hypothetical protein